MHPIRASVIAVAVMFSWAIALAPIVHAGEPYTVVTIFNHSPDPVIIAADRAQYGFNNYPTIRTQIVDLYGKNEADTRRLINEAVARYPEAQHEMIFSGHGVTRGDGTDGGFTRQQYTRMGSDALDTYSATGGVHCDDCGSGRLPYQVPNGLEGGNLNFVSGSSDPNQLGIAPDYGNRMRANVLDGFRGDKNGDGIITNQEFANAMQLDKNPGEIKVVNPNEPRYFRDKDAYDQWRASRKFVECIFLRPAQVDDSYTGNTDNSRVEFKPQTISGYGQRVKDVTQYPAGGGIQAPEESDLNFRLRKSGSGYIEDHIRAVLASSADADKIEKKIVLLPTTDQAEEFIQSSGQAQGGFYTVTGKKISAGKHYLANRPNPGEDIVFDNTCALREWKQPSPMPSGNPSNSSWNNNGGGGNMQPAIAPNSGGLNSLLPLLMQGMLGGGQGQNGQNQNGYGQNGYGAGYGNGQQQAGCAQYGTSPVCGTDGRTYTNQCWMQQMGVAMKSYGVCAAVAPTSAPAPTPNVSVLMNQLAASGIPSSLVDTLRSTVASILGSVVGGGRIAETVIR